jgi:hypothetical protein
MWADAICRNVRCESSSLWWRAASIRNSRIVPLTFVVGSRIPSRLQPDFRHLAEEHHTSFLEVLVELKHELLPYGQARW